MAYFFSTDARSEAELLRDLASPCARTAEAAREALWEKWLNEAGPQARREVDHAIESMCAGELDDAAHAFARLAELYPGWAEAVNKHATALYLLGRPEESIALCHEVLRLKADHFGAWSGMALCAVQTGEWLLARQAALETLRLQPGSAPNRRLLDFIESRLAAL